MPLTENLSFLALFASLTWFIDLLPICTDGRDFPSIPTRIGKYALQMCDLKRLSTMQVFLPALSIPTMLYEVQGSAGSVLLTDHLPFRREGSIAPSECPRMIRNIQSSISGHLPLLEIRSRREAGSAEGFVGVYHSCSCGSNRPISNVIEHPFRRTAGQSLSPEPGHTW